MEGINIMPRDEYYRRLGVAIGKVGQRLLRKGDEYSSLSRKNEDFGRNEEAMDTFFMDIAYQTAHYGMIKRFEEIRDKGTGKPLFTLTAEEVEIVESILFGYYQSLMIQSRISSYENMMIEKTDNLLTRIKEWQDEQANNNNS